MLPFFLVVKATFSTAELLADVSLDLVDDFVLRLGVAFFVAN